MRATEAIETARRAVEICNACRFCDGYCVVFQVMELRRTFSDADLGYIANLCHDCRNCYYACQYAPPHEFAINLPKVFSEIRIETFEQYAWPRPLAPLFRHNSVIVPFTAAASIAVALILTALQSPQELFGSHTGPGAFYTIIPAKIMVAIATAALALSLVSSVVSVVNFWRDTGGGVARAHDWRALRTALYDVLTLRNLAGGGDGCNERDESFSQARRRFHHAVFYGFALCLGSTALAAIYDHVLNWRAPYPLSSMPVVLGAAGGVGILVGATGLAAIKMVRDADPSASSVPGIDYTLLSLLSSMAASGLLLLIFRETAVMGVLLVIHFGVVLSFFLLLPYSKFMHGFYRAAALLRAAMERGAAGASGAHLRVTGRATLRIRGRRGRRSGAAGNRLSGL